MNIIIPRTVWTGNNTKSTNTVAAMPLVVSDNLEIIDANERLCDLFSVKAAGYIKYIIIQLLYLCDWHTQTGSYKNPVCSGIFSHCELYNRPLQLKTRQSAPVNLLECVGSGMMTPHYSGNASSASPFLINRPIK